MLHSAPKTRATAEAGCKKRPSYKPVPKEFRRDGFTYRQIVREADTAIYEQIWNGCREPSLAYELIRIRRRAGFQIGGRFVEPAETYPAAEGWGTDAWTLSHREAAVAKLKNLTGGALDEAS